MCKVQGSLVVSEVDGISLVLVDFLVEFQTINFYIVVPRDGSQRRCIEGAKWYFI